MGKLAPARLETDAQVCVQGPEVMVRQSYRQFAALS